MAAAKEKTREASAKGSAISPGIAYEFRTGVPLGVVVFRYFAYVLAALALIGGCVFAAFTASVNAGAVYRAGYAADNIDALSSELRAQRDFDPSVIPSAFWYAHLTVDGTLLQNDMSVEQMTRAREMVVGGQAESTDQPGGVLDASYWYKTITLFDGSKCVLAYTMVPQFADRGLRDSMPNPEVLAVALCVVSAAIAIVAFAARASRVISRKMDPLVDAARHIERHDLDFAVHAGNVRQVNNVLGAMERMRLSLKDSVPALPEPQEPEPEVACSDSSGLQGERVSWESELQALDGRVSPDLRALPEVVSARMEVEPLATGKTDEPREPAIRATPGMSGEFDSRVGPASDTLRDSQPVQPARSSIDVAEFSCALEDAARNLAEAEGVRLHVRAAKAFAGAAASGLAAEWDGAAVRRAVMALVSNACDCAPEGTIVQLSFGFAWEGVHAASLAGDDELSGAAAARTRGCACTVTFSVKDEGPGFPLGVLQHAQERFSRVGDALSADSFPTEGDSPSAGGSSSAHGDCRISGLAEVYRVACAHGGTLTLANRKPHGAKATLALPVETESSAVAQR